MQTSEMKKAVVKVVNTTDVAAFDLEECMDLCSVIEEARCTCSDKEDRLLGKLQQALEDAGKEL